MWNDANLKLPNNGEIVLVKTDAPKDSYPEFEICCFWEDAKKWIHINKWLAMQRTEKDFKIIYWMRITECGAKLDERV